MRLPKISFAGFRDPVRRPRYVVYAAITFFALAMFVIVALGATSTRWFCAEVCHKVQDDTIRAYEASDHSQISCMACHEPVNASPITFILAKMKSGLEVIPTVGNTFELPLNKGSALSLTSSEMGSAQCTQCHSPNRVVTPQAGLVTNHKVHAAAGIWCTVCHNRVAHNEKAAPPKLTDPSGHKNTGHPDFMTMDACFRCHDLGGKVKMTGAGAKAAPGKCSTCHTASFDLTPADHKTATWATSVHGTMAEQAAAEYAAGLKEQADLVAEGVPAYLAAPVDRCYTCHDKATFCDACHGLTMPHPANFQNNHAKIAARGSQICAKCHSGSTLPGATPSKAATGAAVPTVVRAIAKSTNGDAAFCVDCHHKAFGTAPAKPWLLTHPAAVQDRGAAACFPCHTPVACAECHIRSLKHP